MVSANGHLRLYIAEEQQILLQAYKSFFEDTESIEVVGSSINTSVESLKIALMELKPQVMVIGVKQMAPQVVGTMDSLRESKKDLGLVLLSSFYDTKGMKALREFAGSASRGCAYLLKHNVDTAEQFVQIVQSVADGRVIVDPMLMEGLISSGDRNAQLLKDLSPREMEVLSWMAKGYRNSTIAEVLYLDPKTVERHINSIYSKLGNGIESQHPRIHVVMTYLKAIGLLHTQEIGESN